MGVFRKYVFFFHDAFKLKGISKFTSIKTMYGLKKHG
jgi:hypothetical protein